LCGNPDQQDLYRIQPAYSLPQLITMYSPAKYALGIPEILCVPFLCKQYVMNDSKLDFAQFGIATIQLYISRYKGQKLKAYGANESKIYTGRFSLYLTL